MKRKLFEHVTGNQFELTKEANDRKQDYVKILLSIIRQTSEIPNQQVWEYIQRVSANAELQYRFRTSPIKFSANENKL